MFSNKSHEIELVSINCSINLALITLPSLYEQAIWTNFVGTLNPQFKFEPNLSLSVFHADVDLYLIEGLQRGKISLTFLKQRHCPGRSVS